MADPLITDEDVAEIALGAKTFTSDGQTVEAFSPKEVLDARDRMTPPGPKSGWARVRMGRAVPPGAGPNG